ncbi:MAG: carboxypeptidase-like regulatory domain-containing protein [Bacteroidales bacterium]
MNRKLFLCVFIALNFLTRISAQEVAGFIYDSESKNGIPGVNVYWEKAPARGTITNEDGKFVLISADSCNILVISHIGYKSVKFEFNAEDSINVGLTEATHQIAGVTVKPLDPDLVMKNVVERLDENHPSGSVLYDFFHREVYYSKDSLIHIIEQHVGTVEHKKNGLRRFTNKINLRKSELNYLSKEGRKKSKEVRFMGLSQILWDNPHFDSPMFLKRKSLKDFEFTYFGKQFIKDRVCHVLHYKTSKPCQFSEGTLYLDFDSYATTTSPRLQRAG